MSQLNILYAEAKNFGPYREVRLNFNKGMTLIEGWNYDEDTSNGSGKTFLMDLIAFGLFDEIPRNLKIDEVVNDSINKECEIEICFELFGSKYQIIKKRKPNDAFIIKDGKELPRGKDLKETRQMIQDIIKFDYSTFVNSIYLSQDDKSKFIALSDPKKQEILTQVLDLSIFDKSYKIVSARIKDVEIEYTTISSKAESTVGHINELKAEIAQLQIKANNFDFEKQQEIQQKEVEVESFANQALVFVNQAKSTEEYIEKEVPILNVNQEETQLTFINQKLVLKAEVDRRVGEIDKERHLVNNEILVLDSQKKKYELKSEGLCYECGQMVSGNHLSREISKINSQIIAKDFTKTNLENEYLKYNEVQSKFTQLSLEKSNLEKEIHRKKTEHEAAIKNIEFQKNQHIKNVENLKRQAREYAQMHINSQGQLEKIKNKINDYLTMVREKETKLETESQHLQAIFDKRIELETYIKKLNVLKRMYKNIKYYVFANMVSSLNKNIKYYLDKIFKRNISVNLKTETKDYKGEIKQKFSTEIYKGQKKKSYNSLSKGEKQKISLATVFAFADVLAARSSNSLNLLFLDEILGDGLDSESAAKVVDLLEEIKIKKSIMIIDHHEYVKVLVDKVIRVEKRNDISELIKAA